MAYPPVYLRPLLGGIIPAVNLPRYIDSTEPEDLQDIDGHLRGGIPNCDIDALERYWKVIPGVRAVLFKPLRSGFSKLSTPASQLKETIFSHAEFTAFNDSALPHRHGRSEQSPAGRGQRQAAAASVVLVDRHVHETATRERLEIGGKRRAIHGKQGHDASHAGRFGAIERHQQRELAVGQPERPQRFVKAARQRAGGGGS